MLSISPFPDEDLVKLAIRCRSVYICPKKDFVRQGPLVAYAGKCPRGNNYVGDIYVNFRRIEEHPKVVEAFALAACEMLADRGLLTAFDTVCGIPQGGRSFGQMLALVSGKRFVYADKVPIATAEGRKQEYSWSLAQFDIEPGEEVALAEDVFNNFQNTDHTRGEIAKTGANVVLLVGALNRSPIYSSEYKGLPVIASIREAYPEYEQDDPEVFGDVRAGNVEFDVKRNWSKLMEIMQGSAA